VPYSACCELDSVLRGFPDLSHWRKISTKQLKYQIYGSEESSRKGVANNVVIVTLRVLLVLPILMLLWVPHLAKIALILVFAVVVVALLVFGMRMDSDKVLAVTTARVFASCLRPLWLNPAQLRGHPSRHCWQSQFDCTFMMERIGVISHSFILLIRGLATQDQSECFGRIL
jgi:hypothetical protein